MIHPDTEIRHIDERIGYGIFATARIPRGTIVWALDDLDRCITPKRRAALDARYGGLLDKYAYRNGRGEHILCWDLARFVNHSCEATCLSPGLDFEIVIRDVEAGEQLTDDYASLNLDEGFLCCCGAETCRGHVRAADFARLAPVWDRQLRAAFADIGTVDQPLWSFVRDREAIAAGLADPDTIPSILAHHLPTPEAVRKSRGQVPA
jgi:hypothetical protein